MKKYITALLTATIILLSFIGPALYVPRVQATDPSIWYKTVNGVLDSDYYALYPYETDHSLSVGFSKFGELIDPTTGTGLNYSGRDPFANEGVDELYWLQGWYADIRYTHKSWGDRHIWASAEYANLENAGGDFVNKAINQSYPVGGGRRTSGIAWSDPITVLYNGPRRFIAMMKIHLNDTVGTSSWKLLEITFTLIFEKAKKEVVLFKDIKLVIENKILDSPVDVQFSNRGEWDLGPSPDWASYAHFYHQVLTTCFNKDWHMQKVILREYLYKVYIAGPQQTITLPEHPSIADPLGPYGFPVAEESERVYVNGVFMRRGATRDYTIDYTNGQIIFNTALYGVTVEVYYKLHKVEPGVDHDYEIMPLPHLYDLAQIISRDYTHVGYAAFWPVLSDYTVDGWGQEFEPLIVVNEKDMVGEPDIPFVIGEWDFLLDYNTLGTPNWGPMFRGVTVYGLMHQHDAEDADNTDGSGMNIVDREAQYQLNEVFNPYDLQSAVHKEAARWVEFKNVISEPSWFATDIENVPVIVRPDPEDNYILVGTNEYIPDPTEWDQYGVFSERIENLDTGALLIRGVDYDIVQLSNGQANITFYATGHMKILYSTMGMYPTTDDNADLDGVLGTPDYDMDTYLYGNDLEAPIEFYILTSELTQSWKMATLKIYAYDVDFDDDEYDAVYLNGYLLGILQGESGEWSISEFDFLGDFLNSDGTQYVQIFVSCDTPAALPKWINPYNGATWPTMTDEWAVTVDWGRIVFQYDENTPMPRYEWTIVGRDAHSADSIGAGLVDAAFKDKQIEIGNAGLDLEFREFSLNNIPYVMRRFNGTAPGWRPNYHDSIGRTAFKDDWCTKWPVASSNIIVEGGPLANIAALYFNDYTDAFYGISSIEDNYTPYAPWQGKIDAIACWNKKAYGADATTGYGIISTYLDMNGTVGFIVYGLGARDTFYTSQWFKNGGIHYLQTINKCVTSIILKIDYTDPTHPTFSIVEYLGTISEKYTQHDP